ncbi:MAG: TolC family protein, partial [Bacillota bacterium]
GQFEQQLKNEIQDEIKDVLGSNYQFEFVTATGSNPAALKKELEQLLKNEDIEVVITAGVLSSHLAVQQQDFNKAVIAPYVLDNKFATAELESDYSGIDNFNFITVKQFLDRDIAAFRKLAQQKKITFVMDEQHHQLLFKDQGQLKAEILGSASELKTITSADSVANIFAKLKEAEAVYLSPLLKLDDSKLTALATKLRKESIPVFTTTVDKFKEHNNLLAAYSHQEEVQRRARTTAINLEAFLLGDKLKQQPIYINKSEAGKKQLVIDLGVATAVGKVPDWELLKDSKLVNDPRRAGEKIDLGGAVQIALANNLDLETQNQEQEIAHSQSEQAENNDNPTLDLKTGYSRVRDDVAANSMGRIKEKTWSGELVLKKVLFNEQVNANKDIKNKLEQQSQVAVQEQKLDTILEARTAYYDSLKVQADLELQQENLILTTENLELAKTKHQVGAAGPEDTYRWKSEVAMNSSAVTQAQHNFKSIKDNLKRVLDLELEKQISLVDVKAESVAAEIKKKFDFDTPWELKKVTAKLLEQGIENSVELEQIEQLLEVKKRERKMLKRDYYLPEIGLQASYKSYFDERGAGTEFGESIDEWSVGILASYPLYEGGNKKDKLKQVKLEIEKLKTKRKSTVAKLKQNIRTKVSNVNTQYLKWQDTQKAVTAAENNLELVRDAYSKGSAAVAQLLDAQRALISAKRKRSSNKYDFLTAVAEAQRAIGEYQF